MGLVNDKYNAFPINCLDVSEIETTVLILNVAHFLNGGNN